MRNAFGTPFQQRSERYANAVPQIVQDQDQYQVVNTHLVWTLSPFVLEVLFKEAMKKVPANRPLTLRASWAIFG